MGELPQHSTRGVAPLPQPRGAVRLRTVLPKDPVSTSSRAGSLAFLSRLAGLCYINFVSKQSLGRKGEEVAAEYLKKKGYSVIERNYRSSQWGEIDLITVKDDTLVFVEVKTRTSEEYGSPVEAVTEHKIRKLVRACRYYVMTHPDAPEALRLDVVAISMNPITEAVVNLEHFVSVYEEA